MSKFSELKAWKQEALRMFYEDTPYQDIARLLDLPYHTVYRHIVRHKDTYPKEYVQMYFQLQVPKKVLEAARSTGTIEDLLPKALPYGESIVQEHLDLLAEVVKTKRKLPTIFVIGDTQCKQGVSLEYLEWVGAYIARKKPDIIVHIGDHYDMASLSSYDKGQLSAEGRRVKADIDAGDAGLDIIEKHIKSVPNYNPRKVVTLGNHEERIDRFVGFNPEFEGFIGTDKLAFTRYGWEVYPFLTPANICGINFVHYVQNGMTGKPLGGNVLTRLKNVGESFVMGHQQVLDTALRYLPLSGKPQIGVIVGACYLHDEGYKGFQGNHHFRGCVMLYECKEGFAMTKAVSLNHMRELYEVAL